MFHKAEEYEIYCYLIGSCDPDLKPKYGKDPLSSNLKYFAAYFTMNVFIHYLCYIIPTILFNKLHIFITASRIVQENITINIEKSGPRNR